MTVTALGAGAVAVPAQAQLLGSLPNLGTIVTGTGTTLGTTADTLLPGTGGVVTGVTGDVGGIVGGVQNSVTGTVDQALGGVLGGASDSLLPNDVLDTLIGTLLANSTAAPGTPGTGTSGGPIVLAGGQMTPGGVILDASAPRPSVKVLSRLKAIGSKGRMRMEIKTNEPGIVAVAAKVRPGKAVNKQAAKHSRKLIKVPSIVLGYRKAGKLVVTVKLSRAAQRALGSSKDARMSVGTVASDVFRNQDSDTIRLKIKR